MFFCPYSEIIRTIEVQDRVVYRRQDMNVPEEEAVKIGMVEIQIEVVAVVMGDADRAMAAIQDDRRVAQDQRDHIMGMVMEEVNTIHRKVCSTSLLKPNDILNARIF